LEAASTRVYNGLSSSYKTTFYQLVHHTVLASANLAKLVSYLTSILHFMRLMVVQYIKAGMNNLRASQARVCASLIGWRASIEVGWYLIHS